MMTRALSAVRVVVAATPSLGLAGAFLLTWLRPYALSSFMVRHLMLVIVFEFFVTFFGLCLVNIIFRYGLRSYEGHILSVIILGCAVGVGAISWTSRQWWPVLAFAGLATNRFLPFLMQPPTDDEKLRVWNDFGISFTMYFLLLTGALFLPVPALGVTDAVIAQQQLPFLAEPGWSHRLLVMGVAYFTLLAIYSALSVTRRAAREKSSAGA